jgi:hypothetical protein
MANKNVKRNGQTVYGSTELARRVRAYYGLGAHIARVAEISRTTVSLTLCGRTTSRRLIKIAIRELEKAEAGRFDDRRAA